MCYILGRQATIAARYSFRRRQFDGKDGADFPETPVILYQMQQFKVVPVISSVWTLLHVSRDIQNLNNEFNKQRENGQNPMGLLADLHGLASGFKALSTWYGAYFSEFMKQSLGGHGFL